MQMLLPHERPSPALGARILPAHADSRRTYACRADADQQLCGHDIGQVQDGCLCRSGADKRELLSSARVSQKGEVCDGRAHHLLQSLLLGLGLPCQLGTTVTKTRNVFLRHRGSGLVC